MGERGREEDLGEVGEEAEADEDWRLEATGTGLEMERGEDDSLGPPLDPLVLHTAGALAAAVFGEVEESILEGVGGIAEENRGFQLDFSDNGNKGKEGSNHALL